MLDSTKAAAPQPQPEAGGIDVAPVVIADIEARVEAGKQKYGTLLQTNNGRSALWDLYQELIDACMYIRQRILEEEQWQKGGALIINNQEGEPVAKFDAAPAHNCWLDRNGKFYACQSYVLGDLIMSAEDAIATLRNGKLAVVSLADVEVVKGSVEVLERNK